MKSILITGTEVRVLHIEVVKRSLVASVCYLDPRMDGGLGMYSSANIDDCLIKVAGLQIIADCHGSNIGKPLVEFCSRTLAALRVDQLAQQHLFKAWLFANVDFSQNYFKALQDIARTLNIKSFAIGSSDELALQPVSELSSTLLKTVRGNI